MLQMKMKSGDNEEVILDLVDTHEIVLKQFIDVTFRHQDMRNPDAQRMVRELLDALKTKVEKESADRSYSDQYSLDRFIQQAEDLLQEYIAFSAGMEDNG